MVIKNISMLSGSSDYRSIDTIGKSWKGSKRVISADKSQSRAGSDLKDRFRLEIPDVYLPVLRASYANCSKDPAGFESQYLNVYFPFDDVDQVFERWNDASSQQGWKHRCDGENILFQVSRKTAYRAGKAYEKRVKEVCCLPCQRAENETICKECVHVGYLSFQIAELVAQAGMSKVLTQTLTGITDVISVYNQLSVFQQKYGSLRRSPVPSPATYELIPFVMRRTKKQISRPIYDSSAKEYTGGYTQMDVYPILITEQPAWLEHWTNITRRMRILQMVENGQLGLLMPDDLEIYKQIREIQLLGADFPKLLPESNGGSSALAPLDTTNLAPDYDFDSEFDDQGNSEDPMCHAKRLLSRSVAERIAAVDGVLPNTLTRQEKADLWEKTNDQDLLGDRCTRLIDEILIWLGSINSVDRASSENFLAQTRISFPAMVDEDLALYFVAEIPRLGGLAPRRFPKTIDGQAIE